MNYIKKPIKTVEDIPFFSEDRYWGKAPKDALEKAITVLEEKGWDAFKAQYKNTFDFTFEENRADWRFVVPTPKNFSVLDAGAGMGRSSIPLARVAERVVSLDQSFLRLKYLKMRAVQEGLTNIEVCLGDIFDAPFPKESFDLIVMNGLLEWVGATDRFKNPREAQIASLKIAQDLLKKGGHLYIGIENRFALSYLRGRDHGGLFFTSYMPRWLANVYTKIRKGKRYDTYTYSKSGYEKLLQDAGFKDLTMYLPFPGYNMPRIMIPYDNLGSLGYAIRFLMPSAGLKRKIARYVCRIPGALRMYRYFFFSFGIIVKK